MAVTLPTIHPRQLIRGAVAVALREAWTMASENVFPNRLECYDLDKETPPFIGVYCLTENVVPPRTSPPVHRRNLSLYIDCWQSPERETDSVNAELDLLAAQVEAVMQDGRNRIRELAPVEWRKPLTYESTEISLIADQAAFRFASQVLEFSCQYEWRPDVDVTGLDLFKTLENVWFARPASASKLYTRISLHKEGA